MLALDYLATYTYIKNEKVPLTKKARRRRSGSIIVYSMGKFETRSKIKRTKRIIGPYWRKAILAGLDKKCSTMWEPSSGKTGKILKAARTKLISTIIFITERAIEESIGWPVKIAILSGIPRMKAKIRLATIPASDTLISSEGL